jgi:hypothetical protein
MAKLGLCAMSQVGFGQICRETFGQPIRFGAALLLLSVKGELFFFHFDDTGLKAFGGQRVQIGRNGAAELIKPPLKVVALLTHGITASIGGSVQHSQSPLPRIVAVMTPN